MIRSMTGYGKAEATINEKTIDIQIRTLNSKNTDINIKIPTFIREIEPEIRNIITSRLQRGKIDLFVTSNQQILNEPQIINPDIFEHYYQQLNNLAEKYQLPKTDILSQILRMPDVIITNEPELTDENKYDILKAIEQAAEQTDEFRIQEGSALQGDLHDRLNNIKTLTEKINLYEKKRLDKIRERLLKHLEEFKNNENLDLNRFEQELIYYFEKMDINEEKVRLLNHCQYFESTINDETAQGRKLSFIAQEMGREINTLGSKANDGDMQKIVVEMKDELEKIKEQVMNIL